MSAKLQPEMAQLDTLGDFAQRVATAASHWHEVSIRERLKVLRRAGALLCENHDQLLDCLRADGLSTHLAEYYGGWIERQGAADLLEHTAAELLRPTPARDEWLVRRPDGVVALITPGNSPTINTAPLFSMLLAGNGVLMRAPAHDGGVRLIARDCIGVALSEAGYSPALVEVVTGKTRPLLDAIYASPKIDTIVFFGNAIAGRDVAERGHAAGKKVVLELEGSDCMVVWSDADVGAAVSSAARGYDFSTQPCPIPKHFLVHPAIEAEFVAGLCERAGTLRTVEADPETGPLVPMARPERFDLLSAEAKALGEVALGGYRMDADGQPSATGRYGAPTVVILEVDAAALLAGEHSSHPLLRSPLFCEEVNVPVLPVVRFVGDDAAIIAAMTRTIDAVPFGLRASMWTDDPAIAARFLREVGDVGLVLINEDHAQHPGYLSPWGGPKRSGGPHGESHQFWQKTSHLQGVVASPAIVRAALLGESDKLTLELDDNIARITLNRPQRHNAVDAGLAAELADAIDLLLRDYETLGLAGVVLRGAGPSFCSGADLRLLERLDHRAARRFMQDVTWSLRSLERLPIPTLAAVHGYCMGGGFEFALHCDSIIAADTANFGLPEVHHGLTTTAGAVARLAKAIGQRRAADWLLSGRGVDASTAHAAGLVSELVPAHELDAAIDRWAARVRELPRTGVRATKRLLAGLSASGDSWIPELESFEQLLIDRSKHV